MVNLQTVLYMTVVASTTLLLFIEFRFSLRKTLLIVYGVCVVVLLSNYFLYSALGQELFSRTYTLTNQVPLMLSVAYTSKSRGWQRVFQLMSGILFCMFIHHNAALAYYLSGERPWALPLSYLMLTGIVIVLLALVLRPFYLKMLSYLQHGWWLICLVIALYYWIVVYVIADYSVETFTSALLRASLSFLMVAFYSVLFLLFSHAKQAMEGRHAAELSALQVAALQSRMQAVRAVEDALRIERHDLRHRLQTAAELVARGEEQRAIRFLDRAGERLSEQKTETWCRAPVLDAVFSSYFRQAALQDTPVEAQISLPDPLPVDESDLAMVFANALENAVIASAAQPPEQRKIRCRVISHPSLMLEVSNACAQEVELDRNGMPVAGRDGHGAGTASISAFCQKYHALCRCAWQDGWFSLCVIL